MFVELPPPKKKGTGKVGAAGFSEITRHAIRVLYRELDDAVGLTEIARAVLTDSRRGKNGHLYRYGVSLRDATAHRKPANFMSNFPIIRRSELDQPAKIAKSEGCEGYGVPMAVDQ